MALGVPINPLGVPGSYLARFSLDEPLRPDAAARDNGWRAAYDHARKELNSGFAGYLDSAGLRATSAVFEAVLDDTTSLDFLPTLVHTELDAGHTLFDDEGHLVGVIDWSDACISDPAADLALGLMLPPVASTALFDAYGQQPDQALRNRVRVHRAVGAYLLLLHGIALRDDSIKEAAAERVRKVIASAS